MECNEVFSISRSAMLGEKHGSTTADKTEVDRMLWNSPPVGSLQSTGMLANGVPRHSETAVTSQVKYHAHLREDDDVPTSPVELCDIAVLKIADTTTTSVGQCDLNSPCKLTLCGLTRRKLPQVGLRGSAVERQSLASVLSPSCARPVADG